MNQIRIKKKTTIQAYGEFWDAFLFLKMKQEEKVKGWSKIKLSALTMACFSIEAFANHVGQQLYSDWETCGKWNSPIDKLKTFINKLEVDIKYSGYIERELGRIEKFSDLEKIRLPEDFDYTPVSGLSNEIKEKLTRLRPRSLGQASRISGVTPVAVSILMIKLKQFYENSPSRDQ